VEEAYRLIRKTGKKKIAMLGLSFKPGTDDLRESPIAELIEMLLGKGHEVSIYDKEVSLARLHGSNKSYIEGTIPHISRLMKPTIQGAIEGSEVIVVAKRSPEFREALTNMNGHYVVDLASIVTQVDADKESQYEGICW
jgi:GDP-mannose 6-dehydrogenase